jgi:hypothetical protein
MTLKQAAKKKILFWPSLNLDFFVSPFSSMNPSAWFSRTNGGDRQRVIIDLNQRVEISTISPVDEMSDEELEAMRQNTASHLILNAVLIEQAQRKLQIWQKQNT